MEGFASICVMVSAFSCLVMLLGETSAARQAFTLIVLVTALSGLGLIAYVSRPLWLLSARLSEAVHDEIEVVLKVLEGGDPALLQDSWLGRDDSPSRVELVTYLATLKSLSSWPMHARKRGLLLFGFLPPLTWLMAATVENIFY